MELVLGFQRGVEVLRRGIFEEAKRVASARKWDKDRR
jgi:hypothetical protein